MLFCRDSSNCFFFVVNASNLPLGICTFSSPVPLLASHSQKRKGTCPPGYMSPVPLTSTISQCSFAGACENNIRKIKSTGVSNLVLVLHVAQSHIMQFAITQFQHGLQAVNLLRVGSQSWLNPHLRIMLTCLHVRLLSTSKLLSFCPQELHFFLEKCDTKITQKYAHMPDVNAVDVTVF